VSIMENPPQSQISPEPAPAAPAARPSPAPPAGPVRYDPLNLSRRPFLNSRPVVRASLLLWLLGLVLLLGNVSLFWSYLSESEDKRAEVARGAEAVQRRQAEALELESRLDGIDLKDLNAEIRFLNQKIAERTFSWNRLLDHLSRVMPNDVRLSRLVPATGDQARRGGRSSGRAPQGRIREGQVTLQILGEARSDEALDRFVENLFAHPFADPNLARQERPEQDNVWRFELTVQYIPGAEAQNVIIEEEAPPAAAPGGQQ
jgi:Fimbrial assembly protein (PilN)